MFEIERHRREYHYDMVTVVPDVLPAPLCAEVRRRLQGLIDRSKTQLVSHEGMGTERELDEGGRYLHHLLDGHAMRQHFPELQGLYVGLRGLVAAITSADVILSPYDVSDINVKAYPQEGGTIGWHKDTNGITCLIYLTTNTQGALVLDLEREKPWLDTPEVERREIHAVAGSMLLMQGRRVRHHSAPMDGEFKAVAVFNYYERGDVWRPEGFDDLVYDGMQVA